MLNENLPKEYKFYPGIDLQPYTEMIEIAEKVATEAITEEKAKWEKKAALHSKIALLFAFCFFLCLLGLSYLAYHQNQQRRVLLRDNQQLYRTVQVQKAKAWVDSIRHQINKQ